MASSVVPEPAQNILQGLKEESLQGKLNMPNRRDILKTIGGTIAATFLPSQTWGDDVPRTPVGAAKITGIEMVNYENSAKKTAAYLEVASDASAVGRFGPLGWGIPQKLGEILPEIRKTLIGKDPLDRKQEFQTLWDALYPGRPLSRYADGIDPLSGRKIWGTTRGDKQRHTETGTTIMTLSATDNALWDLRGKLLNRPVHRLIGKASRTRIDVYTRVGEGKNLEEARKTAREMYDRGHRHQKWYFIYGPSDGPKGLRANLELVRVIREELGPDAILMFDNHSMRHEIGTDWVVSLAKQMLAYKPFWLEEPTAPEDTEGYARIKGETGITVAGGEHHYTRWQIKPLLDRKCLDWVQSDPDWCGGISEWLRICAMAREYPGVHVVPHSDHILTDCQCVASQDESLCPLLEYNDGQTKSKLSLRTRSIQPNIEVLTMPDEPGLGPDIDVSRCKRL
jgi:L-alanine-DL-glutamate epimerase-like enolase superfamily enzyme